jgi:uncharacterized protein YjbJ (UPF0337 family)
MNDDKAVGVLDQAKGKIKEAFGNATGNERLANEGAADQVKGHAKETWGNIKDTASHLGDSTRTTTYERDADARSDVHETGKSFRDEVTDGAAHLKDSIKRGLDHLEHKADRS